MLRFQKNEKNEPLRFADPSDRAEKKKKKKKTGIISFALSGAMVLGLLSATFIPQPETAKAFESLPEIETIKSSLNGSGANLRILEVVDNIENAVFGYYIEGQEPKDLEKDYLSGHNSNVARTDAATNYYVELANKGILADADPNSNIYNPQYSNYPLSFTQRYTEYYPWEGVPDSFVTKGFVHELDTPGETVTVSGSYSDEGRGNGAFALTGSSFQTVAENGEYVQDIVTGETGRGAVLVPASEIKDSDVSNYMFYKVSLVPLFVGTDEQNEAEFFVNKDEDSTDKFNFSGYNGKYVFRKTDSISYYGTIEDVTKSNPLDREWIVTGDEREPYYILKEIEDPVSGDSNEELDEDEDRYGISMDVPFVKNSELGGSYPYPVNFIIKPTGFIYKGAGNGQFNINVTSIDGVDNYTKKGSEEILTNPVGFSDKPVSYEKVSYAIDVTNNNLFLKYVLDCSDESADLISSRAKSIQVDEVVGSDLSVNANSEKGQNFTIADYDLIVFESGEYSISDDTKAEILRVANKIENDDSGEKAMIVTSTSPLASELMKKVYTKVEEEKTPANNLTARATSFKDVAPGYVDGNLFFFTPGGSIVTSDITKNFEPSFYEAENSAFYPVINEIEYENVLRQRAGSSVKLDENVNLGNVIRYILNYKKQRQQTTKSSVKILEIEPTDTSELRRSRVAYPDGADGRNKEGYEGDTDDFFPFVYDWFNGTYNDKTITLSTMSTYEFVGKIDDITEEYDLIYIGSDITDFHVDTNSVDMVTYPFDVPWPNKPTNCYLRTDGLWEKWKQTWIDPNKKYREFFMTNYRDNSKTLKGNPVPVGIYKSNEKYQSSDWYLYDFNYKYTTVFNDTDMNGLVYYNIGDKNYNNDMVKAGDSRENRARGLVEGDNDRLEVRYSGNDLTEKKLNELKAFADEGYPVIFADNLLKIDENSDGVTVNNERVDVNSRMYDFIGSVAKKANTYMSTEASLTEYNSKLIRQVSLSKPSIKFISAPKDYDENVAGHNAIEARTLKYEFKILNETDPTPLSTTYSLHLYIDRGADGIFSTDDEVELSSSDLTGGDINSLMGSLPSSGIEHVYTLNRKLPDGIKGMVSWKLLVEKNGGGLHASEKGYAYTPVQILEENGSLSAPITINILQINANRPENRAKDFPDTYNLEEEYAQAKGNFGKYFNQLKKDGNYILNIETVTTDDENDYYNNSHSDAWYLEPENAKKDINNGNYDMLIIGFGDAYGELKDKTAAAVAQFIDTGKAVLFSHDNTAPCNSRNVYLNNPGSGHGYYFNTMVRDRVGLDRYGITNNTEISYIKQDQWGNSWTEKFRIGGSGLDANGSYIGDKGILYTNNNYQGLNSSQIDIIEEAGYDIAYKPSSNIKNKENKTTERFVHGFTDLYLEQYAVNDDAPYNRYKYDGITPAMTGSGNYSTNVVTMENEGQITKYPFNVEGVSSDDLYMGGRNYIEVTDTHLQYYQMNMMADDLIVWFCLGHASKNTGSKDIYSFVPNDVANQYYIFTRGNITYSGCGHSAVDEAYPAGTNPDGTTYEAGKNNVSRNNRWHDPTDMEAKLFINTMIAAYRAAYAPPEFMFVASTVDTDNFEIGTVCLPYETVGQLAEGQAGNSETVENNVTALMGKINFRFNDSNLDAGRIMGFSDFEILFYPDPNNPQDYRDKIYETDSKKETDQYYTFNSDNFSLKIDSEGHLVFYYKEAGQDKVRVSDEIVRIYDSDGNVVKNGEFLTGKVYSLDMQDLVGIFTRYTSRDPGYINKNNQYWVPDTFPTDFCIKVTPKTTFANGTEKTNDPVYLTVTSLKMFDIG